MPPGGRVSKRVRADQETQNTPVPPSTRSSKRLKASQPDVQNEEEHQENEDEWSLFDHYNAGGEDSADANECAGQDNADGSEHNTTAEQGNVPCQDDNQAPPQRAPRKPRPPTKGTQLDRMTKSMGRRMPISVAEGNNRPKEPVQAAKFASKAGVIIRDSVPILTHWKEYKRENQYYEGFVGGLSGRLVIDRNHEPTKLACTDMLRTGVRQLRYRLKKKKYFDGIPANQIRTTSPVSSMSDEQWRALVAKWSNPKHMASCENNKQNRSKVKYHQATGSRSYVAHLHEYKKKKINNAESSTAQNEELDAIEAFETCHTSSKHGLSEPARDAVSRMQSLRAEPVGEGEAPIASEQVVSKVLPKNSSKNSSHQFLKSVGMKPVASSKSSSSNESELREQLAAEAKAAVHGELEDLRKRSEAAKESLARTQKELEHYKKLTEENKKALEENNALLKRIFSLNSGGNASST